MKIFKYLYILSIVIIFIFVFCYFTFFKTTRISTFSGEEYKPIVEQITSVISIITALIYGIIELIKDIRKKRKDD